jgi:hypothetical protein
MILILTLICSKIEIFAKWVRTQRTSAENWDWYMKESSDGTRIENHRA